MTIIFISHIVGKMSNVCLLYYKQLSMDMLYISKHLLEDFETNSLLYICLFNSQLLWKGYKTALFYGDHLSVPVVVSGI